MTPISTRLKEFLDKKGIDSQTLAKELGYNSAEKINRLFREGQDKNDPSVDILSDLTNKFADLDLKWLLTGDKVETETEPAETEKPASTQELLAAFTILRKQIRDMGVSLQSVAQENNSLVRSVLLNQAKQEQNLVNDISQVEKVFQGSLEAAREILKRTYGNHHTPTT
jgi:transcriptional regulator with XRE-family HTH domain